VLVDFYSGIQYLLFVLIVTVLVKRLGTTAENPPLQNAIVRN
jgi:hypothetical protein